MGNEPKIDPATTNLDLALLELIELNPNFSDPRNLAKKLNTSVKKINEALERMDEGKLLDQTFIPWKVRDEASFWGDIGSDENIQLFHRQSLKEAEKALKRPSHERDFRSHVFSVREEDFHLIKEELRDSALQIFSKYNAKPERNSVYCVSYQFFPLTVSDSKNEKARK